MCISIINLKKKKIMKTKRKRGFAHSTTKPTKSRNTIFEEEAPLPPPWREWHGGENELRHRQGKHHITKNEETEAPHYYTAKRKHYRRCGSEEPLRRSSGDHCGRHPFQWREQQSIWWVLLKRKEKRNNKIRIKNNFA